jgi:hypothetical protein
MNSNEFLKPFLSHATRTNMKFSGFFKTYFSAAGVFKSWYLPNTGIHQERWDRLLLQIA